MWSFIGVAVDAQQGLNPSSLVNSHANTIDFSILDSILGGFAATAAFLIVGFILLKYGVLQKLFSNGVVPNVSSFNSAEPGVRVLICPDNCPSHSAEHERSLNNKAAVDELFRKYNELKSDTARITTDLAVLKAGQDQMINLLTKLAKR